MTPRTNTARKVSEASILDSLKRCPFFQAFPDPLLKEVSQFASFVSLPAGNEILRQGSKNQNLYFLLSGSVGVYSDGDLVIHMETYGDTIGEISVLSETPCSASVVTETPVDLIQVQAQKLLGDANTGASESLRSQFFGAYAGILIAKLAATNERAKKFEEASRNLKNAQKALIKANSELEQKVEERTSALLRKTDELEQQNSELNANRQKLEELYNTKDLTFSKLNTLFTEHLLPLQDSFHQFVRPEDKDSANFLGVASKQIDDLVGILTPLTSYHAAELAMKHKRILLAEGDVREQKLAKLALGGTGVRLDIASTIEEAQEKIGHTEYDLLCLNGQMIELAKIVKELRPNLKLVFMTSENIPTYIKKLREYPNLTNIAARSRVDRAFTAKNLVTTIRKLIDPEMFGLEKYLFWGVEVRSRKVTGSAQRRELIQEMVQHFESLGIRRQILESVSVVAEELLMNAIYDAALGKDGKPKYNQLQRTVPVVLEPSEQAQFRYACDGFLLAISVEDPFGSFQKGTLLEYLENGFAGTEVAPRPEKGGAGKGLFLLTQTADMVVFNVKTGKRTEAIALFHVDRESAKTHQDPSFQYFSRD
ncbi:MAG: cyclic nucleotide-binding domain-containing protein [Bdellovibrionaceae bacterium]|nr:cyclic nucleotide-binding domain-containing protein [Bdellovibrionales bacterium]MCB9254235.1 cyclic nucleotide-binding domain-containing protein [Pseudobdellovibrionaceae bacterium]